jgi:hypothetical protein
MNKQTKILIFGGIGLAIVSFFAFKMLKKKPMSTPTPCDPLVDKNCRQETPSSYPEQVLSVITREGTRLRAEPSTNSEIIETYPAGVTFYVFDNMIQDDGLWYRVDDGEFVSGWMRSDVVDNLQTVINY